MKKSPPYQSLYSEMVVIFLQNSVTMQKKDKDKGRYTYQ